MKKNLKQSLLDLADDEEAMEVGRKAIEDELIDLRNSRIGIVGRNNGLVVKESDGTPSDIIRMPPEAAVSIALRAIARTLKK